MKPSVPNRHVPEPFASAKISLAGAAKRCRSLLTLDAGRDRFMRRPEVQRISGLSRSSLYRATARKEFPESIQISTNAVAWVASEVDAWVAARIAERNAKGPK
jgi:prophage regulatory protein